MPEFAKVGVESETQNDDLGEKNMVKNKKQKTWGPIQAARKSARIIGSMHVMEKAKIIKMQQNFEVPKKIKGIISKNHFNVLPVEEVIDISSSIGVQITENLSDRLETRVAEVVNSPKKPKQL